MELFQLKFCFLFLGLGNRDVRLETLNLSLKERFIVFTGVVRVYYFLSKVQIKGKEGEYVLRCKVSEL